MEAYKPERMRRPTNPIVDMINSKKKYRPERMRSGRAEVIELLKQLAEVQAANAKVTAKAIIEKGKATTADKVALLKEGILSQAKLYRQKVDKIVEEYNLNSEEKNTILGEYKELLDSINKKYEEALKNATFELNFFQEQESQDLAEQSFYQDRLDDIKSSDGYKEYYENEFLNSDEYKRYKEDSEAYYAYCDKYKQMQADLKREIDMANETGDMETVKIKAEQRQSMEIPIEPNMPIPEKNYEPANYYYSKIEPIKKETKELQEIIQVCQNEHDKIAKARDSEIDKIDLAKESELIALKEKQTPFQKIAFAFLNRINGAKRFKENTINQLNIGIQKFKEEQLPAIENAVHEKSVEFSSNIAKKKELFKESLEEDKAFITEMFDEIKGQAKSTKDNIKNMFNKDKTVTEEDFERFDGYADETGNLYPEDPATNEIYYENEIFQDKRNVIKEGIDKIGDGFQNVRDMVGSGIEKVGDGIQNAKESVGMNIGIAETKIGEAKDAIISKAEKTKEQMANKISDTKEKIEENVLNRAKQTFNEIIIKGRNAKINFLQKLNNTIQYNINKSIAKNDILKSQMDKNEQSENNGERE